MSTQAGNDDAANTITVQYVDDNTGAIRTERYLLRDHLYSLSSKGVALVTMNRPDSLNAGTANSGLEMRALLDHCERDDRVRVLVLTGTGRGFNSGASRNPASEVFVPERVVRLLDDRCRNSQLGSGSASSPEWQWRATKPDELSRTWGMRAMVLGFLLFRKPLISAVNGLAVGGGANMAIFFMDLVYCSTAARFMWPFTRLGITPELSSTFRFPNQANLAVAKKYMLTSEWMSAEEALSYRLVTEVHPPETFLQEALLAAEKLAGFDPRAVQLTKALINRGAVSSENVNAALDREQHFTIQRMTPERGGDAGLNVADYKRLMESDIPSTEWPRDSKSLPPLKPRL